MKKFAIVIAVGTYSDPEINEVVYAERDAVAFSQVLELHGFESADHLLLIDSQATKTAIESKIKKHVKRLKTEDVLYVYYVGHGFSKTGQNLLACHDTQTEDAEETSLALATLFAQIQSSKCEQVVLFLDVGDREAGLASDEQSEYGPWSFLELEDFVDHTPKLSCFTACQQNEGSYPNHAIHHGIWAFHLSEAFNGDAPLALQHGQLTSASLQAYLQSEVPRALRSAYAGTQTQTPRMYGSGDFLLADLGPILQARKTADNGNQLVMQVAFMATTVQRVESLGAWKKSYRLPDRVSDSNKKFVATVAEQEIKQDLDTVYDSLKKEFEFSRRDLVATGPTDGTGTIATPYFNYSISVSQNPDDPKEIIWTRVVDEIKSPTEIMSEAFASVFNEVFDTLEFVLPTQVILEDFVDAIEVAKNSELALQYDRELTYCEIQIKETGAVVRVTPSSLSIVHKRRKATKLLIQSLEAVKALVEQHHVPLMLLKAPNRSE